jgi:hypothetical protein
VSEDYLLTLERDIERERRTNDDSDTEGESLPFDDDDNEGAVENLEADDDWSVGICRPPTNATKKRVWLVRMNRKLTKIPVGDLNLATVSLAAIMNAWVKTKSAQGAAMVNLWLNVVAAVVVAAAAVALFAVAETKQTVVGRRMVDPPLLHWNCHLKTLFRMYC